MIRDGRQPLSNSHWSRASFFLLFLCILKVSACLGSDADLAISRNHPENITQNQTGNIDMSQKLMMDLLIQTNPSEFSTAEEIKDSIYMELPMELVEGIFIRPVEPINIKAQQSAFLIILIGIGESKSTEIQLQKNTFVILKNEKSETVSKIQLFRPPEHKIPMPEEKIPPEPTDPINSEYSYTVEVLDLREKLGINWTPSSYAIEIVAGDMRSNTIELKLLDR